MACNNINGGYHSDRIFHGYFHVLCAKNQQLKYELSSEFYHIQVGRKQSNDGARYGKIIGLPEGQINGLIRALSGVLHRH